MKRYIKSTSTDNTEMYNYYAFCRHFDRVLHIPGATESDLVKFAHMYNIDLADFCDANDLGIQDNWLDALNEYRRQIDAGER